MSCAPPIPPVPSTPLPPAPARVVPTARVVGVVEGSDGHRVANAMVIVKAANAGCVATGGETGAATDESGEFSVAIEGTAGPAYSGCVHIDARSGGTSGSVTVPAYFTSSATDVTPVHVRVRLEAPQPLSATEARRLVQLLADAINNPANNGGGELELYIAQGGEALRVALEHYRKILGEVRDVRPAQSYYDFGFAMTGSTGRTLNVDVNQEALTRLHSSIIDYGYRSGRFVNGYIRAIASGDAVRLSQIMNPDDIDFPIEKAREMIVDYRTRYRDTATLRAEFVDVDDARATITWRLRGTGANGEELAETIVLRHGDGLLGVVGR